MLIYSALLTLGLVLSAPWWLVRMVTTERYREGLWERLGHVPLRLREFVEGRRVVWVHAVSVGEVLAATRLVAELEAALGAGWVVVVSTTTKTGQALARERFGGSKVFYLPLDFAFTVRAFLRALKPEVLVLMESEVWPRMLHESRKIDVPVVVVNARVSDRSFSRGLRVQSVWGRVLQGVSMWLAQSEEDARRLVAMGARAGSVEAIGNLKYDVRAPQVSRVAELIQKAAAGRPIVLAGSTVGRLNDRCWSEDEMVIQAWEGHLRRELGAMLVLAPRHPERFPEVETVAMEFCYAKASEWGSGEDCTPPFAKGAKDGPPALLDGPHDVVEIVLLDTLGDLAAVYGIADVAFVGGSLVKRGGHNPLEPAQFGVPVVMGPSFGNFRDVVGTMQAVEGIAILGQNTGIYPLRPSGSGRDDKLSLVEELEAALVRLLTDRDAARSMGERGRRVFEEQQGATGRAVETIVGLVADTPGAKAPSSGPRRSGLKPGPISEATTATTAATTAAAARTTAASDHSGMPCHESNDAADTDLRGSR